MAKIIREESREAEVDAVIGLVRAWLRGDAGAPSGAKPASPNGIGILYPRLRRRDQKAMERLCAGLAEFGVVRLPGEGATGGPVDRGIKVSTIHSAKGLQFQSAISMWADLLPSNIEDRDEESERKLMYVALTRAEDVLAVTCSGSSAYVEEIAKNIEAADAVT